MKKIFPLIIIGSILCGCSFDKNESVQSGNYNKVPLFLNKIYSSKKYKVNITSQDNREIIVDNKSYIQDDITYFKYVFKDGYQVFYNDDVQEKEIDLSLINNLYSIINARYYNANYFSLENNQFILKNQYLTLFDTSYFGDKLTSFIAFYEENILKIIIEIDNRIVNFSFLESDVTILPKNVDITEYDTFYKKNEISYQTLSEKIKNEEDLVCIFTSNKCIACENAESLFFQFAYEYNYRFVDIDINNLTPEQEQNIVQNLQKCYSSQEKEFVDENYETYPNYFLTPTTVKFRTGDMKYVKLGFNQNDGNAFIKICLEN